MYIEQTEYIRYSIYINHISDVILLYNNPITYHQGIVYTYILSLYYIIT